MRLLRHFREQIRQTGEIAQTLCFRSSHNCCVKQHAFAHRITENYCETGICPLSAQINTRKKLPLHMAAARYKRLLILGDPGIGKSSYVYWLAAR